MTMVTMTMTLMTKMVKDKCISARLEGQIKTESMKMLIIIMTMLHLTLLMMTMTMMTMAMTMMTNHNLFRAVFLAKELEMTAPADRLEAAK